MFEPFTVYHPEDVLGGVVVVVTAEDELHTVHVVSEPTGNNRLDTAVLMGLTKFLTTRSFWERLKMGLWLVFRRPMVRE